MVNLGRGITNNAVEFLVKLAIDEEKSKTSINSFLKKVDNKTLKLSYAVNVGQSDSNIRDYLKKQNGKVIKLDFDVNKTTSNANFKTFLDSQREAKGSMVFDVNKVITQANVNKALSTITVQKLSTEIDVAKRASTTNFTTFLTNLKLAKKTVVLDVSKQLSRDNINNYIGEMKPKTIGVALKFAKGAFDDINNKAKETTIKGIKGVLELDVEKTKIRIQEQVNKMKLPKFKIDVVANVIPNVSKQAQKQTVDSTTQANKPSNQEQLSKNKAVDNAGINLSGYVGTIRDVKKQLKKEFSDMGKSVHVFDGDIHKAQNAFIKKLEADGAKLTVVRDAQNKEITKISATIRNSENELMTTVYKPMVATYDSLNKKVKDGSKSVRGFVAETDRIDSKELFDVEKATQAIIKKFEQAKHKGHIFGKEITNIANSLKTVGNNNDIDKINKQLDKYIRDGKNSLEMDRIRNSVFKQREQILANITRTEKLYRRTHDKNQAQELKDTVGKHSQDDIFGSKLKGIEGMDIKALRDYSKQLSIVQTQHSQFHAKATEETKNQMGIMSALKVAMEKFPIWINVDENCPYKTLLIRWNSQVDNTELGLRLDRV